MNVTDILGLNDYMAYPQEDGTFLLKRKEPKYPRWKDLNEIRGWFISNSSIIERADKCAVEVYSKNVFLTEKHAKSALAMAQISQLLPYYGGEITDEEWADSSFKYVINRNYNKINTTVCSNIYYLLAFHTEKQRDEFLKNNEQLVKDYLMID